MNISPYIIPGIKFNTYDLIKMDFETITRLVLVGNNVPYEKLFKKDKHREIVDARMLTMWVIRTYKKETFEKIGDFFNRDHTSVISACQTIKNRIETKDPIIMSMMENIKQYLN